MKRTFALSAAAAVAMATASASASTVSFAHTSGLSAEASFTLLSGGSTLQIALRNTSTGAPSGFDSADHLLSSVAFNLNGLSIVGNGSSVHIGASSESVNFNGYYGPGSNVSGEFGYGNSGTTGFENHPNFVSTSNGGNPTRFNGPNLHGPPSGSLNGPQGGLVSNAHLGSIADHAAINDEIIITLNLSGTLADLSFLSNGVRVEFGSDKMFLDGTMTSTLLVPLPGAAGMAGLGLVLVGSRRRR